MLISFPKDKLLNLAAYKPQAEDGGIIAWPVEHTTPDRRHDRREIRFQIKAQLLRKSAGGIKDEKEKIQDQEETRTDRDEL